MSWHWQPVLRQAQGATGRSAQGSTGSDDAGSTAELGLDQRFPTQGDAESWLGEVYPDLMAAGVEAVTLYEEDRPVYGPMRLEPEIS